MRFEERMKRGTTGDIVLEGEVRFAGERIDTLPAHEIRSRGLVHCPERRRPFRELTVLENLLAGAFLRRKMRRDPEAPGALLRPFPAALGAQGADRRHAFRRRAADARHRARADVRSRSCSRSTSLRSASRRSSARSCSPPSRASTADGVPVLLVEQEVSQVFRMANRNYVLSQGRILAEGPASY